MESRGGKCHADKRIPWTSRVREDSPDWWKPENLRDAVTLTIQLNLSGYALVIPSADGTILIYAWTA